MREDNSSKEHTISVFPIPRSTVVWGIIFYAISFILSFSAVAITEVSPRYLILFAFTPLLLLLIFYHMSMVTLLVASLFINVNFYFFSISEILAPLLLISFLLAYKTSISECRNELTPPFFIFLASTIPSYFVSVKYIESWLLTYNIVAFVIIIVVLSVSINNYKRLNYVLKLFSFFALANALHVIYIGVTQGQRAFGFAGIMFVDYVSVALIIVYYSILSIKEFRILNIGVMLLLVFALILTQTRSIWIVTFLSLGGITIYSIISPDKFKINRPLLIVCSALFLVVLFYQTTQLAQSNKKFAGRFKTEKISDTDDPEKMIISFNSLVTRVFIWSTAKNAFFDHPITGIGFYSFPFASKSYSTLPPFIYRMFVKKLTTHETIISILTETGIIGFFGFCYFLYSIFRFAMKNFNKSRNPLQFHLSGVLLWLNIYTFLSMLITDAWLSAHGIVLWGLILGLTIANSNLTSKDLENESTCIQTAAQT